MYSNEVSLYATESAGVSSGAIAIKAELLD